MIKKVKVKKLVRKDGKAKGVAKAYRVNGKPAKVRIKSK